MARWERSLGARLSRRCTVCIARWPDYSESISLAIPPPIPTRFLQESPMIHRSVAIVLALVAVCLMVTSAEAKAAKEKPQRGTVVSIAGSKLVVNVKADKTDKVGT